MGNVLVEMAYRKPLFWRCFSLRTTSQPSIFRVMTSPGTIDTSGLMDASGGNREIAISLVQLFFELTGGEFARLETAVHEGNATNVSSIAHKCAGSSISCGMLRLSKLLKALEIESAQGMPADAPEQLEKIQDELDAAKTAFEAHFNCTFTS